MEINYFLAVALFLAGAAITLLTSAIGRDAESPNTPKKFDPLFLLTDNWKLLVLVLVLGFVFPIMAPETGYEISIKSSFGAGLVHQLILERLKAIAPALQSRPKPTEP